jgi:predicted TIM-barrel fold metal-dependent hydrolase
LTQRALRLRSGKAYVKISGAYRASKAAPGYSDVIPLAKALIAANPDRIVWGTDWPQIRLGFTDSPSVNEPARSKAAQPQLRLSEASNDVKRK